MGLEQVNQPDLESPLQVEAFCLCRQLSSLCSNTAPGLPLSGLLSEPRASPGPSALPHKAAAATRAAPHGLGRCGSGSLKSHFGPSGAKAEPSREGCFVDVSNGVLFIPWVFQGSNSGTICLACTNFRSCKHGAGVLSLV